MKPLQGKNLPYKLIALLSIALIAVGPITFVVLMGWATIELNTAVMLAVFFLCIFLLSAIGILYKIELNITSEKTNIKIQRFFNKIRPYILGVYFILVFISACYMSYFYLQRN